MYSREWKDIREVPKRGGVNVCDCDTMVFQNLPSNVKVLGGIVSPLKFAKEVAHCDIPEAFKQFLFVIVH